MEPPIRNGKIKMADAIEYAATIVYPNEVKSDKETRAKAKKAVRERIRWAFKKGVFGRMHYSGDVEIDATEFFTWAVTRRKWQALSQIEGLPRHAIIGRMSAQESDDTIEAFGIGIPEEKEKLKECYIEAMRKLAECEKYIADIQPDLAELADLRRKKKEISADRSAAGRKGKRSRTK